MRSQVRLDHTAYNYLTSSSRTISTVLLIPTVVHIVHNGGPENISNLQVQAAINNINSKFAQNNNYQIQLCLAQRDPLNNSTNGITRDSSVLTSETMELDDTTLKNVNRWSPTCYLNIWIVKDINSISMGNGVIGYAYMPAAHGQNMDGIVIEAGYFGTSQANDCVGAHELGHYLGLYHTFQNACTNNNCLLDGDQVCDTPPDQSTFALCFPNANSCSTDTNDPSVNNPFNTDVTDLSDDYMDYSALSCYTQFTPGQYDRMVYFLTNVRGSLFNCLSCTPPCPAPLSATITAPTSSVSVNVGASVNFTGTSTNSTTYEWYITPGTVISNSLSASYTFNTAGNYWMKFRTVSSNSSLCRDAIDSVLISVVQPVTGSCVGSLEFLNSNDAVLLPSPVGNQYYYNSNGFTWECWVKLITPFSSYSSSLLRPIISSIDPVVYDDICLSFGWQGGIGNVPNTHLTFKVDGANGPTPVSCDYFPTGGFALNTWYHVAGTMDYVNHQAKLYLNGVLVDTKTNNALPFNRLIASQLSWDVVLNQGYSNPPLGGNMDEVRIWSRVRTPSEIASFYNQCLTGNETDLMLYYRCNQSAGSFAQDASPNNYNGNLTNSAAWSTQHPTLAGSNCSIGCGNSCPLIIAAEDTTICIGNSVQISATAGFLSYTWTPSAGLSNASIGNPIANPTITTTYIVIGSALDTNMQACTSVDTIRIKVITTPVPILNLGNDISLCTYGTHTFDAGPGFESYTWHDGSTNQSYTAFGPGKYWVTVVDSCGGQHADTVLVNAVSSPPLTIAADTAICLGDTLALSFSPVNVFSSFVWSPAAGLNCTLCPLPLALPLNSTQYFLVASTPEGCVVMDSIRITVNSNAPTAANVITSDPTCGLNNGSIEVVSVTGGVMPYVFSLDNTVFSSGNFFSALSPNIYTLVIVDSAGCKLHIPVTIIDHPGPADILLATSNTSVCEQNGMVVITGVIGGTPPYLYSLNQTTYATPSPYTGLAAAMYTISVKDSNNCLHNETFYITEIPEEENILIPNCFSPNSDTTNEVWFIHGNCIKAINCTIYNRWGKALFSFTDISHAWNGTHAGAPMPDGVYFYVVEIAFHSGRSYRTKGHIQLTR